MSSEGCKVSSGHTWSPSAAGCAGAARFPAGPGLASGVSLLCLGADLKSKARPTEAVVAMSKGSPAGQSLEEQPPRALAGLLLFKAQVQEMDVVVGQKETFRPLY